jgi:hypothetical protein
VRQSMASIYDDQVYVIFRSLSGQLIKSHGILEYEVKVILRSIKTYN